VRSNSKPISFRLVLALIILVCVEYTIIQAILAALQLLSADYQDSSDFYYIISNLFFYLVLVILSCRAYLIRERSFQVLIGIMLLFLSCIAWHQVSAQDRSSLAALEYNALALVLWVNASFILIAKCGRKTKRKNFSELVKLDTVKKQKNKCARCKVKLERYGLDFHHFDGNRSNNNSSNCTALCTSCHRTIHVYHRTEA
jgi:hypothetical protein